MGRTSISIVVLLAVISMAAIIGGQVFWVRKAYSIQEEQFNKTVVSGLSDVVGRIKIMNSDSSVTEPVTQKENNFFIAHINETPSPFLLRTLIKEEFEKLHLKEEFEYGIYDCFTDSIVFGGIVSPDKPDQERSPREMQMKYNFEPDGHYFGVIFPSKSAIILKQLDFWIYSSVIILFIAIFFSYTVFVLLQQKRLSEVKNDFINNMTHEFKTPISTINLSADVLSDPQIATQPDRMKQYVEIIRNENDRLRSQVEKVLQIATLNPKKVKIKHEDVDLHKIIMTAAKSLELRVHDEDGELTVNLTAGQHHISGDHVHLSNIIYNLMDNAIKYTERAPQITIFTRNHGDDFVLSISDNGVGISSQHQKMIFDKFYRVPTGDRHNVKGFGLGLFYVKTMVHALKGKIEVRSVLGVGSTFTLKFKSITTE